MVQVKAKSFWDKPIREVLGNEWASILKQGASAALGIFLIIFFGIKVFNWLGTIVTPGILSSTSFWVLLFFALGIYLAYKIFRRMRAFF